MKSHLPNQINWTTAARPHIRGVLTSGLEDGNAQSPNNPWDIRDHGPPNGTIEPTSILPT